MLKVQPLAPAMPDWLGGLERLAGGVLACRAVSSDIAPNTHIVDSWIISPATSWPGTSYGNCRLCKNIARRPASCDQSPGRAWNLERHDFDLEPGCEVKYLPTKPQNKNIESAFAAKAYGPWMISPWTALDLDSSQDFGEKPCSHPGVKSGW